MVYRNMKLDSFWSFDFQSLISFNYLAIQLATKRTLLKNISLILIGNTEVLKKALQKPTPFRKIRQIEFCELMGKLTH